MKETRAHLQFYYLYVWFRDPSGPGGDGQPGFAAVGLIRFMRPAELCFQGSPLMRNKPQDWRKSL